MSGASAARLAGIAGRASSKKQGPAIRERGQAELVDHHTGRGRLDRCPNRNDVLVQKQYMQDIMTSIEEIMNDPSTLSTAVNAIDAVHGKGFAFQPVAKWALYSAFYDASVAHCADKLNAKYIKGPDALGGAETFNFPNCEAYFVARRVGVQ